MANKHYYFYALVDPRNLTVRYIGVTSNIMLRNTIHDGSYLKDLWKASLGKLGLKPYKMIIHCERTKDPKKIEREFMDKFFAKSELLNLSPLTYINEIRVKHGYSPVPTSYIKDRAVLNEFFKHIL